MRSWAGAVVAVQFGRVEPGPQHLWCSGYSVGNQSDRSPQQAVIATAIQHRLLAQFGEQLIPTSSPSSLQRLNGRKLFQNLRGSADAVQQARRLT
jgi:hypothetical protein